MSDLSAVEMFEYRTRALVAATHTHGNSTVPEIAHAAGCYLEFLLNGQPITVIGQTVRTGALDTPPAQDVGQAVAPVAPAKAAAVAKVTKKTPPAAAIAPQPAAPTPAAAAPAPATIPAPVTILECVESLKALVTSKEEGRGRVAAEALLKEFGVTQLSQIPPAKLADFKSRCDNAGRVPAASADPMHGLV